MPSRVQRGLRRGIRRRGQILSRLSVLLTIPTVIRSRRHLPGPSPDAPPARAPGSSPGGRRGSARHRFPRLRVPGAGLATIGLASILAACQDPACFEVGYPQPPELASLFAEGGTLYLSGIHGTYAVQTSDGRQLWHDEPGDFAQGAAGATAFVFSNKTELKALRAGDQSLVWRRPLAGIHTGLSPLRVADGALYFADTVFNQGDSVLAVRASDGSPLWQRAIDGAVQDMQVGGGVVYVATTARGGGSVAALRASDGAPLWQTERRYRGGSLLVDGDLLYLGSDSLHNAPGELVSLQASTGQVRWQKEGERLWAASGGVVYLSTDTTLQAFRGLDGALLWQLANNTPQISSVTADSTGVYLTVGNVLTAVESDSGRVVWRHTIAHLDGRYTFKLATSDDGVYVGVGLVVPDPQQSGCHAFKSRFAAEAVRSQDGSLLWSFQAATLAASPSAAVNSLPHARQRT